MIGEVENALLMLKVESYLYNMAILMTKNFFMVRNSFGSALCVDFVWIL